MLKLNPYLHFDGKCREALDFYKGCLKGEVTGLMTFGEADPDTPDAFKNRVMHAELHAGDLVLMASDGPPDFSLNVGNHVSMMLAPGSEAEQTAVFDALAKGGTVTQPLQDTFWGARFGMLVDRFGVTWMLNFDKPKA